MRQRGFIYVTTGQVISLCVVVVLLVIGAWELVRFLILHISVGWS